MRRTACANSIRYQTAARRAYNSAFKQLQALQGDRFSRQPSSLPEPVLEDPETDPQPEQEPSTGEAKIIAFTPRDMKLQSEPGQAATVKKRTGNSPCAHNP